MWNFSSSIRKMLLSNKTVIPAAIKNVVTEELSEGKLLRRSFHRGGKFFNPNINVNNCDIIGMLIILI